MSDFQVNLVESELKVILEALAEMEKRMSEICETSSDEYGENVVDFSRDLL